VLGAQERTRTSTAFTPLVPEADAEAIFPNDFNGLGKIVSE